MTATEEQAAAGDAGPGVRWRPYQLEAVHAITTRLASEVAVGQLHAACGSGKTLIAAQCAAQLVPAGGVTVVLVPSIALTGQTLSVLAGFRPGCRVLAVCSDDTVADSSMHLADLAVEVSTEDETIAAWLRAGGDRVLVSTYASAERTATAMIAAGATADLLVCDEAHHLTGHAEFPIRRVVDPGFLPAARRLYMTATPRVMLAGGGGDRMLSMDDATTFGPVLYEYPFSRAISERYLKDYRILVVGIADSQARLLLADTGKAWADRLGAPELRTVVAQATLAKAVREYGLRRVLVFTHRVADAAEFSRTLASAVQRVPADQRPDGPVMARHVHGEQTISVRERILDHLRTPPEDGWTAVANARCLHEGTDVPEVDGVLFTLPKRSPVDVVQAVGRALRRSDSTADTATVIVPIVIPDSDELVGDLDAGEFATLWHVVRALRAHDEQFGAALDMRRSQLHYGDPDLPAKIVLDLPPGTSDEVVRQLRLLTVRQTTSSFWEYHGALRAWCAAHGHPHVPSRHVTEDGLDLGRWCDTRRAARKGGWIPAWQVRALDELAFSWTRNDDRYQRFLAELSDYRAAHGHARPPAAYIAPSGYRLGSRAADYRWRLRTGQLPADRAADLQRLGVTTGVPAGRSLPEQAPHLMAEWDADANAGVDPATVSAGSSKKYHWRCAQGHRWQANPAARAKPERPTSCPACPRPGRSLAELHPELADELADDLNTDTAATLSVGSTRTVWWRCPQGHTWQASPGDRTGKNTTCPRCRADGPPQHVIAQWRAMRAAGATLKAISEATGYSDRVLRKHLGYTGPHQQPRKITTVQALAAVAQHNGNVSAAARVLGVSARTVSARLRDAEAGHA
jgi:superfamily II DNA or RNA helicase